MSLCCKQRQGHNKHSSNKPYLCCAELCRKLVLFRSRAKRGPSNVTSRGDVCKEHLCSLAHHVALPGDVVRTLGVVASQHDWPYLGQSVVILDSYADLVRCKTSQKCVFGYYYSAL